MEDVQVQTIEEQVERREVTVQTMLESGAHFGHKTEHWNPKMAPYLHGSRNGVYIFNLDRTFALWCRARDKIVETVARGGNVLLVGPKKQCSEVLEREAKRCGSFYISNKWVGGLLTNFDTIRKSIKEMKKIRDTLERASADGSDLNFTKKERLHMQEELNKLENKFGGIENMSKLPDVIFLVDIVRYRIVVDEARKLRIPIIGIVDSNADPDTVDYIIPANDDANGSLELFICNVADAILEGKEAYEAMLQSKLDDQPEDVTSKAEDIENIEVQNKNEKGRKVTKRKKKDIKFPKSRKIADGINFYSAEYFEDKIKPQ